MNRNEKKHPEPVTLRMGDTIGSRYCVSARDGEHIYKRVAPLVEGNIPVCLCFEGVEMMNTAFLNAAIGQLLGNFTKDHVERLVSYQGLSELDMDLVDRVMKNAEIYFRRKSAYDRAWKEEFGDYGEG